MYELGTDLIEQAKARGIETDPEKRWEYGLDHHPNSREIEAIIWAVDTEGVYDFGGDGDNGETLLYMLDIYFELKDLDKEDQ
jgi:hypothetical protein